MIFKRLHHVRRKVFCKKLRKQKGNRNLAFFYGLICQNKRRNLENFFGFSDLIAKFLLLKQNEDLNISNILENVESSTAPNEINQIKEWALECNIKNVHLQKLINILRVRVLPELPKDARTLLETQQNKFNIQDMEDSSGEKGEFVYFGVAQGLKRCIDTKVHIRRTIFILIHIDGIPIYKSSALEFWPILCKVLFDPDIYQPFVAVVYCGRSKPKSVDEFLIQFVIELNQLLNDGISIDGVFYQLKTHVFVCDRPARSYIKGIKGHSAYSSCERCTIVGYSYHKTLVFPHLRHPKRTDQSFRSMLDKEHHNYRSPLLDIQPPIDMVKSFSLDFMHLICLGVVKSLLNFWVFGKVRHRLAPKQKALINKLIQDIKYQLPQEFQRKPRSVFECLKWKATEFRLLVLYIGPIILKRCLPANKFKHFLLLHAACRMLCSANLFLSHREMAKKYLENFFQISQILYGLKSCSSNMHAIIHLADDVDTFKCNLNQISAFCFESFLGKLKNKIRTPYKPLAQLCRRLDESQKLNNKKPQLPEKLVVNTDKKGNIKSLKFDGKFILKTCRPDNCVILENGNLLYVKKIFSVFNTVFVSGNILKKTKFAYLYPMSSNKLGFFKISCCYKKEITVDANEIINKLIFLRVRLNQMGKFHHYAISLLH